MQKEKKMNTQNMNKNMKRKYGSQRARVYMGNIIIKI